jgi:adenine-specific DNA-methyltransferase
MMSKNTTVLEQQIDDIVYKLYELTYDEVLVVEPEFSERMSMEEYEGLMVE